MLFLFLESFYMYQCNFGIYEYIYFSVDHVIFMSVGLAEFLEQSDLNCVILHAGY